MAIRQGGDIFSKCTLGVCWEPRTKGFWISKCNQENNKSSQFQLLTKSEKENPVAMLLVHKQTQHWVRMDFLISFPLSLAALFALVCIMTEGKDPRIKLLYSHEPEMHPYWNYLTWTPSGMLCIHSLPRGWWTCKALSLSGLCNWREHICLEQCRTVAEGGPDQTLD